MTHHSDTYGTTGILEGTNVHKCVVRDGLCVHDLLKVSLLVTCYVSSSDTQVRENCAMIGMTFALNSL